jgi:hypothetical protein
MSAYADDLRYFYSEDLGDTIELTLGVAATTEELRAEGLQPGRYILRIVDFGAGTTDLWVRQGPTGVVTAAAAAPALRYRAHADIGLLNLPVHTFMVRASGKGANPSKQRDMLAFFSVGGLPTVQVTKISRDQA